jgi:nicotinamidase-related amidase
VTNCFDLAEFQDVVASLGVNKLLLSGLSLDVNIVSAALAAKTLGYEVYVVVDACGTFSKDMREISLMRLQ